MHGPENQYGRLWYAMAAYRAQTFMLDAEGKSENWSGKGEFEYLRECLDFEFH